MTSDVITFPGARRVVGIETGRRAMRSAGVWGLVFGVFVWSSVINFTTIAKTVTQQHELAQTLGKNAGLQALLGHAHDIGTVAGFVAWRSLGVLTLAGAVWGMFAGSRLLRGEEDAHRWELLLVGPTTRRNAAAQGVGGLIVGALTLWLVTAVLVVGVGSTARAAFGFSASLYLATSLTAGAIMFLAVGALSGQLMQSRRAANTVCAVVLGSAFMLRTIADSTPGLAFLRWLSPLGWAEQLQPLTGSRWTAFLPIAGLTAVAFGAAIILAGYRDLGSGIVASHDRSAAHTRLLGGAFPFAVRLNRLIALGWLGAVAAFGLLGGLVAHSAAASVAGSTAVREALARVGGGRGGAEAYLGIFFLMIASLIGFVAASQLAGIRAEEAGGYLDHILVRRVGRVRWLSGRLLLAGCLVVLTAITAGLAAYLGAASQHSRIGLTRLALAGVNVMAPALLVLGLGLLVYGVRPRLTGAVAYAVVAWSLLIELVGALTGAAHWLSYTSVFHYMKPVPAANVDWTAWSAMLAIGVITAASGIAAFTRRDIATG